MLSGCLREVDIGSLAMIIAASASPRPSVSAVVYSPGLKRGYPRAMFTAKGYPVRQVTTLSAPVTLPWPRIGLHTNRVWAFISRASDRSAWLFKCLPRGHREAHAEENDAVFGLFHPVHRVPAKVASGTPGFGLDKSGVELDALGEGAQRPEGLEVFAGLDLDEQIGRLDAFGLSHVDQNAVTVLAAAGQVHALGHQAVFREMPRVAFGGVRAPEDDQVAPVLDFAQSAGDLADVLKRDARGAVAHAAWSCRRSRRSSRRSKPPRTGLPRSCR